MTGIIAGLLGGFSAILFIHSIRWAQNIREIYPVLIFTLPFSGALIRYLYSRFGKGILEGPTLTISVFLSHLGGASTGREGAIIHFCRILSKGMGHYLNFQERKIKKLIVASIGAGFGAALGAPLAGLIFGFEENKHPFFRPRTVMHSLIAVAIAQGCIHFWGINHFHIPSFEIPEYGPISFAFIFILGILMGLIAVLYHFLRQNFEMLLSSQKPWVAGLFGGSLLLVLYQFQIVSSDFQGLGDAKILEATQQMASTSMTWKKILVTVISLGSGFQGGEFFPLAFFGSTFGSAFSFISPAMLSLFASIGIVAVYGAATQTPIACTILAAELFGWKLIPYAFVAIGIASKLHSRFISKSDPDS